MSDKEMENRGSEEQYSFLQETIRPQRKRQVMRYIGRLMATAAIAAVFGVVGAAGFHVTQNVLNKRDRLTERGEAASTKSTTKTTFEDDAEYDMDSNMIAAYQNYWKGMASVGKKCNKSIVSIKVNHNESWYKKNGDEDTVQSGVLFRKTSKKLYILTSDTSISKSASQKVEFTDGATAEAEPVARDDTLGIAVLQVKRDDVSSDTLKAITIQDLKESADDLVLQLNQRVVCFGEPNGIMYSVIPGSIINMGLSAEVQDGGMELCCIDVNYSEDGDGFVADLNGNVVGMLTKNYTDITGKTDCAFVPISNIADTALLLATGKNASVLGVVGCNVQNGYLGLEQGVYVKQVVVKSPAYDAGLRVSDVIKEIGGYEIADLDDLRSCLLNHSAGVKLTIKVQRGSGDTSTEKELTVTLE